MMYCHHHHHHHRYLSLCECTICWPSIVTKDTLQGTGLQWYLWYCGMRRMMILIISTVSIKDYSNLGLFIVYLQSGTIRRSRQMRYHRNHLSPPLENQPNISRTVLAKCFWEMFNVSSFRRQTIPFISVQFWSHEECRRRPFLVDCDKRKCFDLRFLWSENCMHEQQLKQLLPWFCRRRCWSLWSVWTTGSSAGSWSGKPYKSLVTRVL